MKWSTRLTCSLLALLFVSSLRLNAQRIIIPEPPRPMPVAGLFELELKEMQVQTSIVDQVAEVNLDQTFHNPTSHQLQGFYMFPIPDGSSIQSFSMYINGVETRGELLDAQKARSIYEEILRKFQDPALLEYKDKGLFRMSVFPIQPGSDQRIKLTYTQVLPKDNGTTAFSFPIPSNHAKLGPESFSARINVETTNPVKTIYCPTHAVEINRKDARHATVGIELDQKTPPADLQLYFSDDKSEMGASLLNFKEGSENGFFFLNFSPGLNERVIPVSKDITFVLDASGSMAGPKMEQAKKALLFCLENLNPGDRFNIVRFSTEAEALFPTLQLNTSDIRRKAREYIEDLQAIGGTNMEEALDLAFSQDQGKRLSMVIFLTDGKPTIGQTNEEQLLELVKENNTNQRRIFTFGIGTELNTHLLDQITSMTRAYRTYVLPKEDIEVKVSNFFTKVSAPVLTNLEWEIAGNSKVELVEVYPKSLPDLFKGGSISLIGRYKGSGKATLLLKGESNGRSKAYEYELTFEEEAKENDFIPPLWGARAVGYLLDQIRVNGESQEVVQEVIRLSKRYGIITPYTSYLILEDEQNLLGNRRIRTEDALLSPRVSEAPASMDVQAKKYKESIEEEAGEGSVRASEDIQILNQSENLAEYQTGRSEMDYEDAAGQSRNLAENIVNIQGRAVYQNAGIWTDSRIQDNQGAPVRRIAFNSSEYFDLMDEAPDSQEFLALGQNVRFIMNGELIEVYNN
ncbi:MAG: VWA domain-containing protein [Bacteroidetes bacterium]|nr:VWA domain-containing protein [Bacteroidota bacterium]